MSEDTKMRSLLPPRSDVRRLPAALGKPHAVLCGGWRRVQDSTLPSGRRVSAETRHAHGKGMLVVGCEEPNKLKDLMSVTVASAL